MFSVTAKRRFVPKGFCAALVESLESRMLLSVDLTAAVDFHPGSFPDGLVAGDRGTIDLALTNEGDTSAKGVIQSDFYLSTDTTLDASDILLAGGVKRRVSLTAGRTAKYKVAVNVPQLTLGQYYLIADVNTTGAIVETDTTNNVAVSSDTKDAAYIFGKYHGRRLTLTLTDSSSGADVAVTFSSTAEGYGVIANDSTPADPGYAVTMKGVRSWTEVYITPDSGQTTEIQSLDVNGNMRTLHAANADLIGDLHVTGTAEKIILANVGTAGDADNVQIAIGGHRGPWLNLDFLNVVNASIDSNQPIDELVVTEWLDDGGAKDTIQARAIDDLWVAGDSSVPGDFEADVNVQADDPRCAYIGSINISGTVSNATIRSDGDICDVTIGAALDANFLAGVKEGVTQPQSLDDFITVHGRWHGPDLAYGGTDDFTVTGLANQPAGQFFVNSNIAGGSIGTVSLKNVAFDNAGADFGIFVARRNTWGEPLHKVVLRDTVADTTDTLWSDDFPYSDQDFVIQIV